MSILSLAMLLGAMSQTPATRPALSPAQTVTQAAAPSLASATLQPAIDSLRSTLVLVRIEKWKAAGPVRDVAGTNLDSIQRDLDSTLPPLVKAADAAPSSVTSLLPVFRNVNALYDVLLRVSTAADLAAPRPQVDALQRSLAALDQARRSLGDTLQTLASAQDQQIVSLRTQLAARPVPTPEAAPAPAPAPKPKPKKKKTSAQAS